MKSKKGFTLMELIVVIAIIGILLTIGIPSYGKYIESTKINAIDNNVQNFYLAIKQTLNYSDSNGLQKYIVTNKNIPTGSTTPIGTYFDVFDVQNLAIGYMNSNKNVAVATNISQSGNGIPGSQTFTISTAKTGTYAIGINTSFTNLHKYLINKDWINNKGLWIIVMPTDYNSTFKGARYYKDGIYDHTN